MEWGALPHKVSERKICMKASNNNAEKNHLLDDGDVLILKEIVDENPNFY